MPTAVGNINLTEIAKACGYLNAVSVETYEALDSQLEAVKQEKKLSLIEKNAALTQEKTW